MIDLVIEILRGSKDRAMAKACLVEGKVDGIKFKSKESKIMAAPADVHRETGERYLRDASV